MYDEVQVKLDEENFFYSQEWLPTGEEGSVPSWHDPRCMRKGKAESTVEFSDTNGTCRDLPGRQTRNRRNGH